MGSAILVPKAHSFVWSRDIEIGRVAQEKRTGKLRFSTDFTLSIPLCLCVVTAFPPKGVAEATNVIMLSNIVSLFKRAFPLN